MESVKLLNEPWEEEKQICDFPVYQSEHDLWKFDKNKNYYQISTGLPCTIISLSREVNSEVTYLVVLKDENNEYHDYKITATDFYTHKINDIVYVKTYFKTTKKLLDKKNY